MTAWEAVKADLVKMVSALREALENALDASEGLPEGCQGLPDTHQLAKGWPEHYVWNPFAIKILLERAGLRMGAPSAGPCLSEAWVSGVS